MDGSSATPVRFCPPTATTFGSWKGRKQLVEPIRFRNGVVVDEHHYLVNWLRQRRCYAHSRDRGCQHWDDSPQVDDDRCGASWASNSGL